MVERREIGVDRIGQSALFPDLAIEPEEKTAAAQYGSPLKAG
jgi:hypothetical protein